MNSEELRLRTKRFALEVLHLVESLPRTRASDIVAKQLLRSATSVGANNRSACRARSRADFNSKITVVEEEADESLYWLELLEESGVVAKVDLSPLLKEADELIPCLIFDLRPLIFIRLSIPITDPESHTDDPQSHQASFAPAAPPGS